MPRPKKPDMKCDEMRASGTPPENCDGSGTEEGQPQNRKEHQEYLVPRTPTAAKCCYCKTNYCIYWFRVLFIQRIFFIISPTLFSNLCYNSTSLTQAYIYKQRAEILPHFSLILNLGHLPKCLFLRCLPHKRKDNYYFRRNKNREG